MREKMREEEKRLGRVQERILSSVTKNQKNTTLKNTEDRADPKGEKNSKMSYRGFVSGDEVKIVNNIYTTDGTLYKDSVVKIDQIGFPDKDLRVVDNVGKIWYIDYFDIKQYRRDNV